MTRETFSATRVQKNEKQGGGTNVWRTLADSMTSAFISLKLDSLFQFQTVLRHGVLEQSQPLFYQPRLFQKIPRNLTLSADSGLLERILTRKHGG